MLGLACLAILGACSPASQAQQQPRKPMPVQVSAVSGRAQLLRGGAPFLVKGAGGDGSMALLARIGGNTVRTWGADKLGEVLDAAEKHGLVVIAGIWLGHERHGFRYEDPSQVARQKEMVEEVVSKYRDHPALLLWGLGNEMEGDGSNASIWKAVNDLATMVKTLDPNHPTMTVIAEVGGDKIRNLHRLCPAIDLVGINTYAGAASVAERYVAAGGRKPFLLTEFGPPGTWEVPKTAWGAPVEPSSTEKAEWYRKAWTATVGKSPLCLGGCAFLWGSKQETTATWFGMLLPDGSSLESAQVMGMLWSGREPTNRCPRITSLTVADSSEVRPGAQLRAVLQAADPDGDGLTAQWELRLEASQKGFGGETEPTPAEVRGAVTEPSIRGARIRMPDAPGAYRLFVYVRDGHGGAATANVPLFVKGPVASPGKQVRLPLSIYVEGGGTDPPYVPSGWMGNTAAISMDPRCTSNPASGKECLKCSYTSSGEWAGVVWQDPPNDWGDQPGGYDLTGARRLTWKARGAQGGEVVTFLFGILGADKRYPDTAQRTLENVRLTEEWQVFHMDLSGLDLRRIKTGFGWTVAGQGHPVVFYLDDIRIE